MREVTKEQFSANSTIDGRRIDKAVEDVVDRANAVEKRDLKRRFFQTQFIGSYAPATGKDGGVINPISFDDAFPFLDARNTVADAVHEYRVKGVKRTDQTSASNSMIETASFYFNRPVVITAVSAILESGSITYRNDFEYTSDTQAGKADMDSDDFAVSISVDNPFLPENRELSSEVYHRFNFNLKSQLFRPLNTATPPVPYAPTSEMMPDSTKLSDGTKSLPNMWGVVIDDQALNIPVPRNSRVRFSIVIPEYYEIDDAVVSGWGSDVPDNFNLRSFASQALTWVLTALEGAE